MIELKTNAFRGHEKLAMVNMPSPLANRLANTQTKQNTQAQNRPQLLYRRFKVSRNL